LWANTLETAIEAVKVVSQLDTSKDTHVLLENTRKWFDKRMWKRPLPIYLHIPARGDMQASRLQPHAIDITPGESGNNEQLIGQVSQILRTRHTNPSQVDSDPQPKKGNHTRIQELQHMLRSKKLFEFAEGTWSLSTAEGRHLIIAKNANQLDITVCLQD
jgi:hypothetical protein